MALAANLAAARAAAAKSDWAKALTALLAAWRETPAPQIADAIEAISARACAGMEAPTATTAKLRNAAWDALAMTGEPVAMGMLCATVDATKGNGETLARLELLLPHGPDPRLSRKICDWVETPIYNVTVSRTQKFWKRIWPLLAEVGDPRILSRARGFASKWTKNRELNAPEKPMLAKKLAKVMPALEAAYGAAPILARADVELCAALAGTEATAPGRTTLAKARTEAELLAAIYAAPDDDGPRIVYGDWLQERGDPRGEFIALQIAKAHGKLTKDQARREKDLLAEYVAKWIPPLPINKTGVKFERGFLVEGESPEWFGDDPAWATVRRTNAVPISDASHTASLRSLHAVPSGAFTRLAKLKRPLALEELAWQGPGPDDTNAFAAFAKIRVLPKLRRLELEPHGRWLESVGAKELAWLIGAPATQQLEELRVLLAPNRIPGLIAAFAKRPLRRLETYHRNDALAPGWQTTIERDAAGALAKLTILVHDRPPNAMLAPFWGTDLIEWLAMAPVTLFSAATIEIPKISVRAFAPLRKRFVDALGRQQRVANVEWR